MLRYFNKQIKEPTSPFDVIETEIENTALIANLTLGRAEVTQYNIYQSSS